MNWIASWALPRGGTPFPEAVGAGAGFDVAWRQQGQRNLARLGGMYDPMGMQDWSYNPIQDNPNAAKLPGYQGGKNAAITLGTGAEAIGTGFALRRPPFGISPATLERIGSLPVGARPNPATYLSADYIDAHLAQFNRGASYLAPKEALDRWGRDMLGRADGQFVMPSGQLNDVLLRASGNMAVIERELGIPAGAWQGREFVRIDISDPRSLSLRMATGNESGANPLWLPGGKMPTGYSEAVINQVSRGSYTESSLLQSLRKLRKGP